MEKKLFKNIYSLEQGSFLETNLDKYNLKKFWNIRKLNKKYSKKRTLKKFYLDQLTNILFLIDRLVYS